MSEPSTAAWPALPLQAWRDTCAGLHMALQIVGKTRLALSPVENHWWHVPMYLSPRGLRTSPMPCPRGSFEVAFDFIDHVVAVERSDGVSRRFALASRSVASFFDEYVATLASLDVRCAIRASPVEVVTAIPFAEDRRIRPYDADAVHRCWRILLATDQVMKRFRGRFLGKQSPSHFFWGSFDLAATRFSGRVAPPHPGGVPNCPDYVMVEAYSHECSSCGFWPGGGAIDAPAFYAYTYPQPPGYAATVVGPEAAYYDEQAGEFILPYEAVRLA
ncbi:MAG: DUF5996 family protein, partial [Burkholderiaceae bacterium]